MIRMPKNRRGKIRCEEVLQHLLAYLDRELEPATSVLIAHHLELCRGCFSRAEFERKLKAHLRNCGTSPAPARLRARLKQLMERY
jgi:anti-sigma factor (TIGR02949 family)